MNFAEIVEALMAQGYDEETAYREAYAITHPESYDPADYE